MKKLLRLTFGILVVFLLAGIFTATAKEDGRKTDTLRILMGNSQSVDMATDPTKLLVEKITGYKLKIETIPGAQNEVKDKLALLLASGESYDLIKLDGIEHMKEFAPKGYFMPLDDLLAQYGKNITANTDKKWFEPCKIDGKIFAIPIKRSSAASIVGTLYRKDIFDKYNIKEPKTPEEFKAALVKIKKETDLIPFSFPATEPIVGTISSAFGFTGTLGNYWYDVDGKLVPRVKMKGYVDYLKYVSGLVKDGLIDKEFAANKDEVVQRKMASGKAASAWWAWWWWSGNEAIRKNEGAKIAFMKPLKSADGKGIAWLWGAAPDWTTCIPKTSKYPRDAMKFLNSLSANKNFERIFLGKEGVHYKKDGGVFVPTEMFTKEKKNAWMSLFVTNENFREKFETISYAGENKDVAFTFYSMRDAAKDVAAADPTAQLPVPEAQGKYFTALDKMEKDFVLAVTAGVKSPEDYPDFIAKWEKDGGAELEKQWNEIYAKSKK